MNDPYVEVKSLEKTPLQLPGKVYIKSIEFVKASFPNKDFEMFNTFSVYINGSKEDKPVCISVKNNIYSCEHEPIIPNKEVDKIEIQFHSSKIEKVYFIIYYRFN